MDLKEELKEVQRLKDGLAALREREKETEEVLLVKMKEFKERIEQGESTGDPVKDYCILDYGYSSVMVDMAEKNCHQLIEKTKSHTGEFVLLVQRQIDPSDDSGIFGLRPEIKEELFLGVLENDKFVVDLEQKKCGFPTDKFVRVERESMDVQEGVLSGSYFFGDILTGWNTPIELGAKINRTDIKIGDKEVRVWFKKQGQAIGIGDYLVLFRKMAQLLGRPITESPALDAKLDKRAREKIKRITELAMREKEARKYEENAAKTLSYGFTTARETHQKIVEELQGAIKVGLTKHPAIREFCKEYKVDLPEE